MRQKNSFFNILGSLGSYFISMIFQFITQACIVKILGIEYSGVNGLFTNILTMLSIAELGIGTTIIFKLYKPIANNDHEKIKSWLKYYNHCYKIVALSIAIFGLIITPFIPVIAGVNNNIRENIVLLYLISLLDTVVSYIMTYKRSLLYADQKNYVINIIHMGYTIFMNLTQIIILFTLKNYIIFLLIKIIYRILENLIINIYVNKKYSFIKGKAKNISAAEKQDITSRIKAIFLQKISFVVNKGIDSILISIFISIASVGYYTNYNLIVTSIAGVIFQVMSSMTASVGNLLTEKNNQKNYLTYKKINMLNSFLTGISIALFLSLITTFINLWLGKSYILPIHITISFATYIYADSIRRAITMFKEAAGICKEDKYMYIYMTIINLLFSIILCYLFGMCGVILGTSISYLFLIYYSYPKYVFAPLFKKKIKYYYQEQFKYLIIIIATSFLSYLVCSMIPLNVSFISLLIKTFISIFIYTTSFYLIFRKTEEFNYYKKLLKKIVRNK